jgi:hypothetical protein
MCCHRFTRISHVTTTHFPFGHGFTHMHASALLEGLSPSEHVLQLACPTWSVNLSSPASVQEVHVDWPVSSLYWPTVQFVQSLLASPE